MNAGPLVVALVCLGVIGVIWLGFEIFVFRLACLICKVPQPGMFRSIGMVLILLIVPGVVDGIIGGALTEAYRAGGYPLWEAGLVQFFLALPIHMLICSWIHAKMMSLTLGEGLAVWFVEKLLKFVVLLLIVGAISLLLVLGQFK
ncbi:MAG: hypothetical protein ACRC8S_12635 [Fimbriiglobus sp.]